MLYIFIQIYISNENDVITFHYQNNNSIHSVYFATCGSSCNHSNFADMTQCPWLAFNA
jgi:hypothetical protein